MHTPTPRKPGPFIRPQNRNDGLRTFDTRSKRVESRASCVSRGERERKTIFFSCFLWHRNRHVTSPSRYTRRYFLHCRYFVRSVFLFWYSRAVVSTRARGINGKLLLLRGKQDGDSCTRACRAMFLSEPFYVDAAELCSRARRFCTVNAGDGKRHQKHFPERSAGGFTAVSRYCYIPIRKLVLPGLIYRAPIRCVNLFSFCRNPVRVLRLSPVNVFLRSFYLGTASKWHMMSTISPPPLFFHPSTRKELFLRLQRTKCRN